MDTVFIVARGKWEQFSFLHIYHHSSIFMVYWLITVTGGSLFTTSSSMRRFFYCCWHFLQDMMVIFSIQSLPIPLCTSSCEFALDYIFLNRIRHYSPLIAVLALLLCRYLYYLLTSFNIRPSWGVYLTQFQMVQFATMNAQAIYNITFSCPYPILITKFYLAYIISLFALFMQFYLKRWSNSGGKGKGEKNKRGPSSSSKSD